MFTIDARAKCQRDGCMRGIEILCAVCGSLHRAGLHLLHPLASHLVSLSASGSTRSSMKSPSTISTSLVFDSLLPASRDRENLPFDMYFFVQCQSFLQLSRYSLCNMIDSRWTRGVARSLNLITDLIADFSATRFGCCYAQHFFFFDGYMFSVACIFQFSFT